MAIIPGTIVVNFHGGVAEATVEDFLEKESLYGTQVSTLCNRWAIEVPPNKEQEYVEKLKGCDLIRKVHESFIKGKITPKKKFDKDKKNENRSIEISRGSRSTTGKRTRGGL